MMSDLELREALAAAVARGYEPGEHDYKIADRVLSALRASGRLAPAVEGDVVEAARIAVMGPDAGCFVLDGRSHGQPRLVLDKDDVRRVIALASPIIAAATEARHQDQLLGILAEVDFAVADHTDGSATMKTNIIRLGIIRDSIKFALKGSIR